MLSFHSLAPVPLYTGTKTKAAEPKPSRPAAAAMLETTPPADAAISHHHDGDASAAFPSKPAEPGPVALTQQHTAPSHESRDSGVADLEAASPASQHQTASIDFSGHHQQQQQQQQQQPAAEAGPSSPSSPRRSAAARDPSLPQDGAPDETHRNAIAYRRDPETVIAYLVPLPTPTVQGTPLANVPTRYFLYAPPAPHLVRPAGGGEGYVRRLNRRWQQSVRASRPDAAGGRRRKRASLRGARGGVVRGVERGLDRLRHDDVTFLARVHPSTVTHLILIHPPGTSSSSQQAEGAPEDLLRTFREQVFESKKRAKRGSLVSAALFLPALAIDTAAIFFGGLAEVDGIWMLVSIKAYRTARVITRKIGPEPKTLQVERDRLIEDAKRSGFPPPEPEADDEEDSDEPGAIRRSVDALRRSMGSVTYRISHKRNKGKKAKGAGEESSDESRPETNDASRSDIEGGFTGGELEHHQEEQEGERAGTAAEASASAGAQEGQSEEPELSGWLEHASEDEDDGDGAPGPSNPQPSRGAGGGGGGILVDNGNTDESRSSGDSDEASESKGGENFQLTFYPSPAMDVLTRYLQEACHRYNGQAFSSPAGVATEQDVLDVMDWQPEQREHDTAEQIAEDEQWQRNDIEDDLRLMATKAAKAWDKACRKAAKNSKRPMGDRPGKKRVFAGRFRVRRPRLQKGKATETPAALDPEREAGTTTTTTTDGHGNGNGHAANIRARLAAVRDRASRKGAAKQPEASTDEDRSGLRSRAAGTAALLCVPCAAIAKRATRRGKTRDETSEGDGQAQAQTDGASRGAMRQRFSERSGSVKRGLSSRGDALRQRMGALKAKKSAATEGPTPGFMDETAGVGDADTSQPKKSKAGRLLAVPASLAAAIGAAIKKRRRGTKTSIDEGDTSSTTGARKTSKFSAVKRHLRSLRTRVTKNRRVSRLKDYVRDLQEKRKSKKTRDHTGSAAAAGTKPKSVREHGAIVGLVGGFLALPAAKMREVRDKRRQSHPESDSGEAPANIGATEASSTVDTRVSHDRPRFEPPISEEGEDAARELSPPPIATQYLPGHGQSEIPVAAASEGGVSPTEPRLGSSQTAVNQPLTSPEPQQPPEVQGASQGASATAAERFRSIKNGIGNLKPKRRAGEETTDQTAVGGATTEPLEDELAPPGGGRFQTLKDGLGNLKLKRRTGTEAPHPEGPAEAAVVNDTPPSGDSVPREGRFKSIKDGIGNLKPKKTGAEEPPKQKVYKDSSNPGFMDRMRWLWLMTS